ncbi:UNVERIFIED_CONTAM: hypothetical protein GTU68_030643 [Idotea baltica]|nr:hypothetical protein [Idotea baltica]
MNIHEYQSKELFRAYGLPVLDGILCYTPGEAEAAADILGGNVCVVKAQVHAGGRGKAGGVKLAKNSKEARAMAEEILGMTLVTPQTGEKGKLVSKVYVEDGCNIDKELYISMLVDRGNKAVTIIASTEGGMDIEEVAENTPDKIINVSIDPTVGYQNFHGMEIAMNFGLDAKVARSLVELLDGIYRSFLLKMI